MTNYVLLDEHLSADTVRTLRQLIGLVTVTRVGYEIAPPAGTNDPELLKWCVEHGAVMLSCDRNTMTKFHRDLLLRGEKAPGLVILPEKYRFEDLQMVAMIVQVLEPYELEDAVHYVGG